MALITAAQVIGKLPIHQGIDPQFIEPYINVTELAELQGSLSKEFYAVLLTHVDGSGNITATGNMLVFIRDYVRPLLAYAIGAAAINGIQNQAANSGVNRFSGSMGADNAGDKGGAQIKAQLRSFKNSSKLRQFDWLGDSDNDLTNDPEFDEYFANPKTDWRHEVFTSSTGIL